MLFQPHWWIRRTKALIKELSVPAPGSSDLYFPDRYSQSFLTQCMACLWKQHWSYWRNPPYTAVRLLFTTFIAVMFGTIFWDLGSKRSVNRVARANFVWNFPAPKMVYPNKLSFDIYVGEGCKISLMQWVQCMLLFYFLGYKMLHQCNRWLLLREQSSIEKEQQECILLCHMPSDR